MKTIEQRIEDLEMTYHHMLLYRAMHWEEPGTDEAVEYFRFQEKFLKEITELYPYIMKGYWKLP